MGELKYFFSYSRKDSEFVLKLAQELREAGVNLWLDQLDILGGRVWDREVEEALQSCQGVIAVLSPESAESKNVMDELAFALDEEKLIIPVVIRPGKMPFRLRRLQYIDFTGSYGNGFARLLKALNLDQPAAPRETGKAEAPVSPDVAEPVEESPVPAEAAEALERRTEPAESEPKVVPGLEPAGESTSIFSRRRKSPGESAEPRPTQAAPEQTDPSLTSQTMTLRQRLEEFFKAHRFRGWNSPSQTTTWRTRLLGALVGAGVGAACGMLVPLLRYNPRIVVSALFGGLGAIVGAICGLDKKKLVGALGGAGIMAACMMLV